MWIFTRDAFCSVVSNSDDLMVRCRFKTDAQHLAELLETDYITSGKADYRFRLFVDRPQFADVIRDQVLAIDYPNFKDVVCTDANRAKTYDECWAAMQRLQNRSDE